MTKKPTNTSAEKLKSYLERIENLTEDKANISADIQDVFAEARGNGFDIKIMRDLLRLRKKNPAERQEWAYMFFNYAQSAEMDEVTDIFSSE